MPVTPELRVPSAKAQEVIPMKLPLKLEDFFDSAAIVCPHSLLIELGLADEELPEGIGYFLANARDFATLGQANGMLEAAEARYQEVVAVEKHQ